MGEQSSPGDHQYTGNVTDVQGKLLHLPAELIARLRRAYDERYELIQQRLEEFRDVGSSPEATFYELCYCLCTPATAARSALRLIEELRRQQFHSRPLPTGILEDLLRTPAHYVRFHRTKAQRLARVHGLFGQVWQLRHSGLPSRELRRQLVQIVPGFGMKEASHFLRNTGASDVAVIDRHIVRWMQRCGLPVRLPRSRSEYEAAEAAFTALAEHVEISLPALDLLLWSLETGEVLR